MIARKSFLIVFSYFITRFIGWIGLIVLAKLWTDFAPEALGVIGFAMSFLALFNIIGDLGFSQAHIKRVSEGKDLGTCIGTFATIKFFLSGIFIGIVLISIFIWKSYLNGKFSDSTTESVVYVFIIYYLFLNLRSISDATFSGRREIAKQQISHFFEVVKIPFMIIVALAGVGIIGVEIAPSIKWPSFLQPIQLFIYKHSLGSLATTYVIAIIASFAVGIWFLSKYPIKKPNWKLFKSYFDFALPTILFSVVGVISVNIDKLMIGFFWTSTEVGYYFTVQQIINILMILYIAVSTVLFPTISDYHSKNQINKINETTNLAERYISMVMIPPLLIIIVFVNPLIKIMLSNAFLPAASVLIILSVYTFILSINRTYGALIGGINKPRITVKIYFFSSCLNIILNYLFIPKNGLLSRFGINGPEGAAIATLISIIVVFIGLRIAAKKLTGIKVLQSHTPRHIIAGFLSGIVLYYIAYVIKLFPIIQWYHLLFFSGLGLVFYLAILYLLKEFKKQDLYFFIEILRPIEMFKYISSELSEKPKKPK